MGIYALKARNHKKSIPITFSLTLISVRATVFGIIVVLVFFTKNKLSFKFFIIPALVLELSLNIGLTYSAVELHKKSSLFWLPFVIEEVVLCYFCLI